MSTPVISPLAATPAVDADKPAKYRFVGGYTELQGQWHATLERVGQVFTMPPSVARTLKGEGGPLFLTEAQWATFSIDEKLLQRFGFPGFIDRAPEEVRTAIAAARLLAATSQEV